MCVSRVIVVTLLFIYLFLSQVFYHILSIFVARWCVFCCCFLLQLLTVNTSTRTHTKYPNYLPIRLGFVTLKNQVLGTTPVVQAYLCVCVGGGAGCAHSIAVSTGAKHGEFLHTSTNPACFVFGFSRTFHSSSSVGLL